MTTVNPLSAVLSNAFSKLDRNKDGNLDRAEFNTFYEVLKPGTACDDEGQLKMTASDYFKRMDADRSGSVTEEEVLASGVVMPSELCSDGSVDALLHYLQQQLSDTAALAATMLSEKEKPETEDPGNPV